MLNEFFFLLRVHDFCCLPFVSKTFSISSQHYDFLPPLITEFSRQHPQYPHFRIFESTTAQILDEVAQGYSELDEYANLFFVCTRQKV